MTAIIRWLWVLITELIIEYYILRFDGHSLHRLKKKRNIRIGKQKSLLIMRIVAYLSFLEDEFHEPNNFSVLSSKRCAIQRSIFAIYLRIFGRACTGMYRRLVFRSSGIGGPTTAASSSACEQGLENLNFNCLPRPDGLRRKRIIV